MIEPTTNIKINANICITATSVNVLFSSLTSMDTPAAYPAAMPIAVPTPGATAVPAACDGDYSGIAAIGKFVGFFVLLFAVLWLFTQPVLLNYVIENKQ